MNIKALYVLSVIINQKIFSIKKIKKIHRLLICYEGESSQNKINSYVARDFNASFNIRNIAIDIINGKSRPAAFCRITKSESIDSIPKPAIVKKHIKTSLQGVIWLDGIIVPKIFIWVAFTLLLYMFIITLIFFCFKCKRKCYFYGYFLETSNNKEYYYKFC